MKAAFNCISPRIGAIVAALALGVCAAYLAGCSQSSSDDGCWAEPVSVLPSKPIDATLVQSSDTLQTAFDFEELWESADVVCTASFVDASDSFMIEPLNGADPMYFTDFYFDGTIVYKGSIGGAASDQESSSGGLLTVRQRGGKGERVATANNIAASFYPAGDYLLFLYRIEDGSEYNTQGDHLYLIGGQIGAWGKTTDGTFASSIDSEIATSRDIEAKAALATDNGSDATTPAEKRIAKLDEQHRAGEIPDDYYEAARAAAVLESTGFARILSYDEALAVENELIARILETQDNSAARHAFLCVESKPDLY